MARSLEETRRAKREQMACRRAADPDAVRAYQRGFHQKNRDRNLAKMRAYYAKRFFWSRAMKLRGTTRATATDLARQWRRQKGLCALTGEQLTRENAELDHVVPKTRGGGDDAANLRWVTHAVNFAKRDLTDAEFLGLCQNVMRWLGSRIALVEASAGARAAAPERVA